MPRMSAENRSTGVWREGGHRVLPPARMNKSAKALWYSIVNSKPADWFSPGSAVLLGQFCELAVQQKQLIAYRSAMVDEEIWAARAVELEKRIHSYSATLSTLATKMRLSVQAIMESRSFQIEEKGTQAKALFDASAMKKAA